MKKKAEEAKDEETEVKKKLEMQTRPKQRREGAAKTRLRRREHENSDSTAGRRKIRNTSRKKKILKVKTCTKEDTAPPPLTHTHACIYSTRKRRTDRQIH